MQRTVLPTQPMAAQAYAMPQPQVMQPQVMPQPPAMPMPGQPAVPVMPVAQAVPFAQAVPVAAAPNPYAQQVAVGQPQVMQPQDVPLAAVQGLSTQPEPIRLLNPQVLIEHPATVEELQAALPNASGDFILAMYGGRATLAQAQAQFMVHLQAENSQLRSQTQPLAASVPPFANQFANQFAPQFATPPLALPAPAAGAPPAAYAAYGQPPANAPANTFAAIVQQATGGQTMASAGSTGADEFRRMVAEMKEATGQTTSECCRSVGVQHPHLHQSFVDQMPPAGLRSPDRPAHAA